MVIFSTGPKNVVAQRFLSGPVMRLVGALTVPAVTFSAATFLVDRFSVPTALANCSSNQMFPSGPMATPDGPYGLTDVVLYTATAPLEGESDPTWLASCDEK